MMKNLAVFLVSLLAIVVLVESKCRGIQCGYDCCKSGERCVVKKEGEKDGYGKSNKYGKPSSEDSEFVYECVDAATACGTEQCKSGEVCYQITEKCEYDPCPSEFKCLNPTGLCGLEYCSSDKLCFYKNSGATSSHPSNSVSFACLLPQQCVGTTCASPKQCKVDDNCPTPPCTPTFQCVTNTNNCGNLLCSSGKRCVVNSEPCGGLTCSTYECADNSKMCGDIECPYEKLCFINEETCTYEGYVASFACLKNKSHHKKNKKEKY